MIERKLNTKTLYKGLFLDFIEDEISIDNTEIIAKRQYFMHPGGVCILPITKDGKLVLVRQYRTPVNEIILEFPAGKKDAGEASLITAKRELKEETGYTAASWHDCGEILPCPGYSSEKLSLYIAEDLTAGATDLDHGEVVETVEMSIPEFENKLLSGEINDAKTLCAYLFYKLKFTSKI
jgi:ADP-ribose pyrophosphatase